ncbi:MAG: uridine phosphorylase, partial [Spirochaetales bacterium]
MNPRDFTPHHMNITADDIAGNGEVGRYIILPGSDGRAAAISEHFTNRGVREHSRRHNFYFGTLVTGDSRIEVATVATGMGCPSVDIIVNELVRLGARRLLRVGTSGSLQPGRIPIGSIVIATAAARDEGTTRHYMPMEVPAVASVEMVRAAQRACAVCGVERSFTGIVHTKDSLFARELDAGPRTVENERFMKLMTQSGVLASEMEAAMLFTLAQVYTQELLGDDGPSAISVEAGAVL